MVPRVNKEFIDELEKIRVEHNFEYGNEFEVALCKVLRKILPEKYGICRGYLTDIDGNVAGDDIIIFDQVRFPTIALREKNDYSRKEYIPIESAYAYIEAKYSLNLWGSDGQTLQKALSQVAEVKKIVLKRESVPLGAVHSNLTIVNSNLQVPFGWPKIRNPFYSAVIASNIRKEKGNNTELSQKDVFDSINTNMVLNELSPDNMVLGKYNISIPAVPQGSQSMIISPFYVHMEANHTLFPMKSGLSFGLFVINLMWALDWIELGKIPWPKVLLNLAAIESSK